MKNHRVPVGRCLEALLIITGAMALKLAHEPIRLGVGRGSRNIAVVAKGSKPRPMFRV